jgi:hypothetical protein
MLRHGLLALMGSVQKVKVLIVMVSSLYEMQ